MNREAFLDQFVDSDIHLRSAQSDHDHTTSSALHPSVSELTVNELRDPRLKQEPQALELARGSGLEPDSTVGIRGSLSGCSAEQRHRIIDTMRLQEENEVMIRAAERIAARSIATLEARFLALSPPPIGSGALAEVPVVSGVVPDDGRSEALSTIRERYCS